MRAVESPDDKFIRCRDALKRILDADVVDTIDALRAALGAFEALGEMDILFPDPWAHHGEDL